MLTILSPRTPRALGRSNVKRPSTSTERPELTDRERLLFALSITFGPILVALAIVALGMAVYEFVRWLL